MWVDKYRPLSMQKVIGQQGPSSNAKKLAKWLQEWGANHSGEGAKIKKPPTKGFKDKSGSLYKAALLSGPPGIGKTTTAQLVCQVSRTGVKGQLVTLFFPCTLLTL